MSYKSRRTLESVLFAIGLFIGMVLLILFFAWLNKVTTPQPTNNVSAQVITIYPKGTPQYPTVVFSTAKKNQLYKSHIFFPGLHVGNSVLLNISTYDIVTKIIYNHIQLCMESC